MPSYPAVAKEVKVRHLLSHTSGIRNYTELEGWRQGVHLSRTTEEMLKLFQDLPLEFSPGARFSYSNSGYFLLGGIIEKVGYAEYLKEHLFAPAARTA